MQILQTENPNMFNQLEQLKQQPGRLDNGVVELIKVATERIVERFQPEKIILFGSQARGDATQHSDVDLLIVFKEVSNNHEQAVAIRRILSDLSISKDIVVTTQRDIDKYGHLVGTVLRPALKEGRVLYERC
jgi:uncharacterized protein